MKLMNSLLALILLLFLSVSVQADEVNDRNKTDEPENFKSAKIAVFPFLNYSGSGMKYLSLYIPELIMESLDIEDKSSLIDAGELKFRLKKKELPREHFYDADAAKKILDKFNVEIGIIGRFIIHGKNIRIDFKAVERSTGRVIDGDRFDSPIGDNFLAALGKYTAAVNQWVKTEILKEDLFRINKKKEGVFTSLYNRIQKSRAGIIVKNRWIFALVILLVFYIFSRVIVLFFEKVLKKLTQKTSISMDEEIVDIVKKPAKWIVIFFGIKLSLFTLKLPQSINKTAINATTAVIIILVIYIISNIAEILIQSWGKKLASKISSRIDNDLVPLFMKIAKIIIFSIGIIMVLSRFNVDIAPLIASLGIAGFAIGFAVKDSLSNVIGGIVLILDQSFAVGDKVSVDGDTGIIMEVGLRNTKIQTFDNEIIVLPNGDLMNKKFKNYVLPDPKIRVVVKFGVAYGTDVDLVEEVVMKAIMGISDITDDPAPGVVFTEMADFSLNFQAKFFVPEYVNQYSKWIEATKAVYNALNDAKISIPFPTHTVYIEKE